MLVDRHGWRAGARGPRPAGGGRCNQAMARSRPALFGAHQQLQLHPSRLIGSPQGNRTQHSRRVDLDIGPSHRRLLEVAKAQGFGFCYRRGRSHHRASRGWLHSNRRKPRLRCSRREPKLFVRDPYQGHSTNQQRFAFYCHQPRCHRPFGRRRIAGYRLGCRPD